MNAPKAPAEQRPTVEKPSADELDKAGLTDDERISREDDTLPNGARVTPGPADAERLPKP